MPQSRTEPTAPVISRTNVSWTGAHRFVAGPEGRTHEIDADAQVAPGPVETLLNALAACSAVDVLDILAKRRTPVQKMSIRVEAERRAQAPRRVLRLLLEFSIDGDAIEPEQAQRAIRLSYERYCSVAASLGADIDVQIGLTLNGKSFPPSTHVVWRPDSETHA